MTKRFLILALTIVLEAVVGLLTWNHYLDPQNYSNYDVILALTLFVISMTTFFGFLMIGASPEAGWPPMQGGIRVSIAGAVVVTYLFLVAFTVLMGPQGEVSTITTSFIQSFSGIVGVTIAFYFGAAAAAQIFGKKEQPTEKPEE